MPTESYVDLIFDADTEVFITIFLITYSASIIALFVSSIVKNPTKAMAFMPFFLIFQLIFSGGFFQLSDDLMKVSYITVSKWGLNAICAQGDFNDQNMVTPMNTLVKMKGLEVTGDEMARMTNLMLQTHEVNDVEIVGNEIITPDESMTVVGFTENDTYMPLSGVVDYLEANPEAKENMMQRFGEQNYNANYESSQSNVLKCWMCLIGFIVLFASMSTVSLEFIDRDRR